MAYLGLDRVFTFLQPKQQVPLPRPVTQEVGYALGSYIRSVATELYNPDELILRRGKDVYERMLRDDQVKAAYQLTNDFITGRTWRFDCGEDDPQKQEMADFFSHMLERELIGTWQEAMEYVLHGRATGHSVSEMVFAASDYEGAPRWVLRAIKPKPFYTFHWHIDDFGNINKLEQDQSGKRVALDPRKFVIFVVNRHMNATFGESDLRAAHRWYWYKDNVAKFQTIYLERLAAGFPVVKPTQDATAASNTQLANLEAALRNMSAQTSLILPKGYEAEVLQGDAKDVFERALDRYDTAIARSLLVPTLMGVSPQQSVGALAQARQQFEVFFTRVIKLGDALADVLNEQLFRQLAWWNYGTNEYPLFAFERHTEQQKQDLAKAWSELVQKGSVRNTYEDEIRTRELMGYGERDRLPVDDTVGEVPTITTGRTEDDDLPDDDDGDAPPSRTTSSTRPGPPRRSPNPPSGRRPSRGDRAAAEAGEAPWRRRVNFQEIATELRRSDTSFARDMADVMDDMFAVMEQRAKELTDTPDIALDVAMEQASQPFPPELNKRMNRAIRNAIIEAYWIGFDSAQEELLEAAGAPPLRGGGMMGGRRITQSNMRDAMERTTPVAWLGSSGFHRALTEHLIHADDVDVVPDELLERHRIYAQGVRPVMAEEYMASKAFEITGALSNAVIEKARTVLVNSIRDGRPLPQIVDELRVVLADLAGQRDAAGRRINIGHRLETIARTNITDAFNQARLAGYNDPNLEGFVEALEYSATLDLRTTDFCRAYDGKIYPVDSAIWNQITPPNHFNCRSLLIGVTAVDDWEPSRPIPNLPSPGFGGNSSGTPPVPATATPVETVEERNLRQYELLSEDVSDSDFERFLDNAREQASRYPQFAKLMPTMTESEIVAIHAYTIEHYADINDALRNFRGTPPMGVPASGIISVLDEALSRMPAYSGIVRRGVRELPDDIAQSLRPGAVFLDTAFGSTTQADDFVMGGRHRFIIQTRAGGRAHDIEGFSGFAREREILFRYGTRFRVLDVEKRDGDTYYTMEEMEMEFAAMQENDTRLALRKEIDRWEQLDEDNKGVEAPKHLQDKMQSGMTPDKDESEE